MVTDFVTSVQGKEVADKIVVVAKVRQSNEKILLKLLMLTQQTGMQDPVMVHLALVSLNRHQNNVQWNLDLTKSLGTGQICSLNGGFVVSNTSI